MDASNSALYSSLAQRLLVLSLLIFLLFSLSLLLLLSLLLFLLSGLINSSSSNRRRMCRFDLVESAHEWSSVAALGVEPNADERA